MSEAFVLEHPTSGEQLYRIEASATEWIQANADGISEVLA